MSDLEIRGLYCEDFEIGIRMPTPRRTITQTDIVNYACLSGDFNARHVDWEFCKTQPYGEPIAHGPLVFAIASGLSCQTGINDGTVVAFLGLDNWRIHMPVKHGDTIHMVNTATEKRLMSKRGSRYRDDRTRDHQPARQNRSIDGNHIPVSLSAWLT